jgi:TfoX/Sxy family transcriptional regulator of competence genes
MGYNRDLEYRIDHLMSRLGEITKKKMFGGIGYLINGKMCFGIHQEFLVLRVSPEKAQELMKSEYVTPFDITGRPMKGWILVSPDILESEEQLLDTLRLGIGFAETLPKK